MRARLKMFLNRKEGSLPDFVLAPNRCIGLRREIEAYVRLVKTSASPWERPGCSGAEGRFLSRRHSGRESQQSDPHPVG